LILGKDDLQGLMGKAVSETRSDVLAAIDQIGRDNANIARVLRDLVAESFDRPYFDRDSIAMLSDAAHLLRHLPDTSPALTGAARDLRHLQDSAVMLRQVSNDLMHLHDSAGMLAQASVNLRHLQDSAILLRRASEEWHICATPPIQFRRQQGNSTI
jgi:hypothetical protein